MDALATDAVTTDAEPLVLIAEFENHDAAESAAHKLEGLGVNMDNVSVHGQTWLDMANFGGPTTRMSSIRTGAKIGGGCTFLASLLFEISFLLQQGAGLASFFHILTYVVIWTLLGGLIGGAFGYLFGLTSIVADPPDWIANEYGDHIKNGCYLLMVFGSNQSLGFIQPALGESHPLSVRISPVTQ